MKEILTLILLLTCLPGFSQKKKEKPNYLRREKQEPETWFTFCGKKNGRNVKLSDLTKAEGIKPIEKYFDGLDVMEMEVSIKLKAGEEQKFSATGLLLTEDIKEKFSSLKKGDKLIFFITVRNRSTQVVSIIPSHTFIVSG